ncbi:MAG: sigma 54-interacting transcriptional regulator [Deltaproteobacteria bacterium]|nr:sigma 54-interacting transcriptional regulator [Deltaproteobacteria bacterium]MBW2129252.1 sigma 54-interacting transcriptional regulator [Deltaproteobacteria bacterium]
MTRKADVEGGFISYDQLRSILDGLNVGIFTVDAERRITSFNRTFQALTGYREEEVVGMPCHEVFLNDLCRGGCMYHRAVMERRRSMSFDIEILDANEEKRLITKIVTPLYDARRRPAGCIEILQDHSLFEDLLDRIRYDEQRLKIILDNLDIGVFTVTRGGHISFFNARAESISGYDRREILGKPCSLLLGGEETEAVALLKASIGDGKSRSSRRLVLAGKGGKKIPIQADCMALRNEYGEIVGGLATIQDLSLIHRLSREIRKGYTFGDMIGRDPTMQQIFETIRAVASSDATLLIEGATGTGKDLLAKVTHNASKRAGKPYIKVNCAALPENLIESELFGYVKGAFTGADRDKPGRFQEADGGTIFLDEIGDLPLPLQAKLLRVLEDKEFYPLGGGRTTRVNVRIIAATNRDLERKVKERTFREDLFYRLNVIRIQLPPLKDRRGDIPLLIDHLLKKLAAVQNARVDRISKEAMEILLNYDYPGNVRELENILEHALILCPGEVIEKKHLPLFLQGRMPPQDLEQGSLPGLGRSRESSERELILAALKRHGWHRSKAAKELRIDRSTLWRKMKKYELKP